MLHHARLLLAVAAAAATCSIAEGSARTYSSLDAFLDDVRANVQLQTFDGANDVALPPQNFTTSAGFAYTVGASGPGGSHTIFRLGAGVGATWNTHSTRIDFHGRSVSAVCATFRVLNTAAHDVGGEITVTTDAGEVFSFTASPGGTFFGIAAVRPFSWVEFNSANMQYYEAIDDLRVGLLAETPDAADSCGSARTIGPGVYAFSNVFASTDGPIGSCTAGLLPNRIDVWYRLVAPSSGSITIDTCNPNFDTVLEIFDACGGAQLACNDDFCANRGSRLTLDAEAGRAYLIRISGYAGAQGTATLTISPVANCPGDFNQSGQVSVQDLFDFMTAFFAPCP